MYKSVPIIFLMFDADLRHSIRSDRKACRDIRARCGAKQSRFRRDQRVKTGASVDIGDPLLFADSDFTLARVGNGNCLQSLRICLPSKVAHHMTSIAMIRLAAHRSTCRYARCQLDVYRRWRLTLLRPGRRAAIASPRYRGEFGAQGNGVSARWHRSRHPLWY
jgi:hypothetical protein